MSTRSTLSQRIRVLGPWTLPASLAVLAGTIIIGCGKVQVPKIPWKNPLVRDVPDYKGQYGMTPAETSQQLRQIVDHVGGMTAAEHQLKCSQLIDRLGNEPDALLRRDIVYVLGAFPDPHPLPGMQAALQDPESIVRIEACRAWARRGNEEAFGALVRVMEVDDDIDVRHAAVRGLSNFRTPAAVQALASVLSDRDPATQLLAMQSLRASSGQDLGNDVRAWRQYVEKTYGGSSRDGGSLIAQQPDGVELVR